MLEIAARFEKLVGSIARPGLGPTPRRGGPAPVDTDAAGRDDRRALPAGRASALALEPAVTLAGIASTLGRIYSAGAA